MDVALFVCRNGVSGEDKVMKKIFFAWAACALVACTNMGPVGKGAEDAIPQGGKFDGFFSPTLHGRLAFGLDSQATLSRDARFHAWDIVLAGEATVELSIHSNEASLDTVMYLYKKQADGDYGSYLEKNDDADGTVFSALRETLAAGEYRVLVKGYKQYTYGSFALTASCTGSGCEGSRPDPARVPDTTQYTQRCAKKLFTILISEVTAANKGDVRYGDRGALPQEEQIAIAHLDSREEFEYMLEEDSPDDHELSIDRVDLNKGTLIAIDGPDSTYEYLFDAQSQLVMFVWDEQSPEVEFFCGLAGEPVHERMNAECAAGMISFMPCRESSKEEVQELSLSDPPEDELEAMAQAAYNRYLAEHDSDPENMGEVYVDGIHWHSVDGHGEGAHLLLTTSDHEIPSIRYKTGGAYLSGWVFFSQPSGGELRTECTSY